MKTNFLRIAFGCALALLACIPIAHGQTVTGSITGEVTDPSGAVVAGAQVVAHNLDTGVDYPAKSNGAVQPIPETYGDSHDRPHRS